MQPAAEGNARPAGCRPALRSRTSKWSRSGRTPRLRHSPHFSRPARGSAPNIFCRGLRSRSRPVHGSLCAILRGGGAIGLTADLEFMPWTHVPRPDDRQPDCRAGRAGQCRHPGRRAAFRPVEQFARRPRARSRRTGCTIGNSATARPSGRRRRSTDPCRPLRADVSGRGRHRPDGRWQRAMPADITISIEVPTVQLARSVRRRVAGTPGAGGRPSRRREGAQPELQNSGGRGSSGCRTSIAPGTSRPISWSSGAGAAGMTTSLVAALEGLDVVLCEKSDVLGWARPRLPPAPSGSRATDKDGLQGRRARPRPRAPISPRCSASTRRTSA